MGSGALLLFMMTPSIFLMNACLPMESHWGLAMGTSISKSQVPEDGYLDLSLKLGLGLDDPNPDHMKRVAQKGESVLKNKGQVRYSSIYPSSLVLNSHVSHLAPGNQKTYLDRGCIPRESHTNYFLNSFPTTLGISLPKILSHQSLGYTKGIVTQESLGENILLTTDVPQSCKRRTGNTNPILGLTNEKPEALQTWKSDKGQETQHTSSHEYIGGSSVQRDQEKPPSALFEQVQNTQLHMPHTYIGSSSTQNKQEEPMRSSALIGKLIHHGVSTARANRNSMSYIDLWFRELEVEMRYEWDMAQGPQNEMSKRIHWTLEKARLKVAMGFIACLKFFHFQASQDLEKVSTEGWRFILRMTESWKTIDLKSLEEELGSTLGRSVQYVSSSALLKYLIGLKQRSDPSVVFYCNLYNTWVEEATKFYGQAIELIGLAEFEKKLQNLLKSENNVFESQIRPLEPSTPNLSNSNKGIKRKKHDMIGDSINENAHTRKKVPSDSTTYFRESRQTLQKVGRVWDRMMKPSDVETFFTWLKKLLDEIEDNIYGKRSISSFKMNKPSIFMWGCKRVVSHFLTILLLLHPNHSKDRYHQLTIDGLNFLSYHFEQWRYVEVEKVIKIKKIDYKSYCQNLQPSLLLRYLLEIPQSSGRSISINILWGMWVAWSHWNRSIVIHKRYMEDSSELVKELAMAAAAELQKPDSILCLS